METIKAKNTIAGEIRLERADGTIKMLSVARLGIFDYEIIQDALTSNKDGKETIKSVGDIIDMIFLNADRKADFRGVDVTELIQKGLKVAIGGDKTPEQKKTRGRRKKESPTS